jgi:hypothetical protein
MGRRSYERGGISEGMGEVGFCIQMLVIIAAGVTKRGLGLMKYFPKN